MSIFFIILLKYRNIQYHYNLLKLIIKNNKVHIYRDGKKMTYYKVWSKIRIAVLLILLGVVFVNLVMAQLKTYDPKYESQAMSQLNALTSLPADNCSGLTLPTNPEMETTFWRAPTHLMDLWLRIGCSPKYPYYHEGRLIDANQWLIFLTILLATLLARICTSSWTVALIVCATLLSSSQPTHFIASIGFRNIYILLFTAWFTALAAYLRSGSKIITSILIGLSALAAYMGQVSLIFACMTIPIFIVFTSQFRQLLILPMLKRVRIHNMSVQTANSPIKTSASHQLLNQSLLSSITSSVLDYRVEPAPIKLHAPHPNNVFHAFDVPFSIWVFTNKRWKRLATNWFMLVLSLLATSVVVLTLLDQMSLAGYFSTIKDMTEDISTKSPSYLASELFYAFGPRLSLCCLFICFGLFIPPHYSINSFFETCWIVLSAIALILIGCFFLPSSDAQMHINMHTKEQLTLVISWLEPTIIAMGIAAVFNMIRASDSLFHSRSL